MPGPPPAFCPCFPDDFLQQARQLARRRSARFQLRQRASLVLLLDAQPALSNVEAGRRVQLHPDAVRAWRRRWHRGDFTLEDRPGRGRKPTFSPLDEALVKALACESVAQTQLPLSRQSLGDLASRAGSALGKSISRRTVGRILDADAIKPWRYEHWIFPRDPQFAAKAGPILDLYAGRWEGQPLGPKDYVLSADEKTSIQARIRCHPSLEPAPGRPLRVEPEYERGGALQYLAAWDVRRGYVIGRCEFRTGIDPFGRLVAQAMEQEPYRSGERVFWVVDNGSSHRGEASVRRLATAYPRAILVHTPVHASWLNQVEIYFSIIQRKVLTPNDFANLAAVEERLRLYEALSNRQPRPFQWKFDRQKLAEFLQRLEAKQRVQEQAQAS
jgi:Homeodomain-like domain/DDE superfamily endonuclease